MIIETNRLRLRPVMAADTPAIARVVFSDPEVVGMLAHDTRDPADALHEAGRWTSIMGTDGEGGIWDNGGMGLFAISHRDRPDDLAGVAGFYMERNEHGRWNGEYFYALGSAWHGQGLMSEAADAFAARLRAMDDLGVIYAGYWDMINEASGRLLRRTGLEPKGRKPVTSEYGADRCRGMFDYDLWRLSRAAPGPGRDRVAVLAARRAGAFVAEEVVDREDALRSLSDHYGAAPLPTEASAMFDRALAAPGMRYCEIRGAGETGTPVNRLG